MTTPANWYPDPENAGQLRYWDGALWTEHRAPDPNAAPAQAPTPEPAAAPDEVPASEQATSIVSIPESTPDAGAHRAPDGEAEPVAPSYETPAHDPPSYEAPSYETPTSETPSYDPPPASTPPFDPPPATPTWDPPPGMSYEPPASTPSWDAPPAGQAYQAPAGQAYQAPAGQAYQPPAGQAYQPPPSPSWGAPPPGQSYEGASFAPPPGPPGPPTPPTGGPGGGPGGGPNKKLLIGILSGAAALILILALVLVYVFVIRDDSTTVTASSSSSSTSKTKTTSSRTSTTESETTTAESPSGRTAGPVTDGNLTFTITDIEAAESVTSTFSDMVGKTAQGTFAVVHLTVGNVGPDPVTFLATFQRLNGGGQSLAPDDEATVFAGGGYADVAPGTEVETIVVFDVPDDMEPESMFFQQDPTTPGVGLPF